MNREDFERAVEINEQIKSLAEQIKYWRDLTTNIHNIGTNDSTHPINWQSVDIVISVQPKGLSLDKYKPFYLSADREKSSFFKSAGHLTSELEMRLFELQHKFEDC